MHSHANRLSLWNRVLRRFGYVPPSEDDLLLRSEVNQCISCLKANTSRYREVGSLDVPTSARTCNAFAWRLLQHLTEPQAENVFFSPCGIVLALAVAYNGACGETKQAIATTLGLGDASLEEVNTRNANLLSALTSAYESAQVCIATSLWGKYLDRMSIEFIRSCQEHYDADVRDLAEGPDAINAWIHQKTQGLIDGVVGKIEPLVYAIVINTVYFHSKWETPFLPEATRDTVFTMQNGRRQVCPMMYQSGNYPYQRTQTFQAARLPYKDGFSMVAFLPNSGVSLKEMLAVLTQDNWESRRERFRDMDGSIGLPRFRFDYSTNLKEILIQMGMGIAFDPAADFSGMSPEFYLGNIQHRAFVEVNEEGTTAAAVTAEELCGSSGPPPERFTLILDRPFYCAIEDERTGALLFLGMVMNPSQK